MKNPRKFLLDAKNILGKLLFVISHPRKYKRGYIREDGMIFWAWSYSCKNNERWVDQETFDRYVTKSREWIKSRSRAWYRENLDRERARGRKTGKKYRERHPEAIRKRYAVWYQKGTDTQMHMH